ncbi:MAG: ELWxxDGT repeat protein [Flavobacteriales bacterium]
MRQFLLAVSVCTACSVHSQSTRIGQFAKDQAGGPSPAVSMGGKLYFSAYDVLHGRELWASDGTEGGTYLVKDIAPGTGSGVSEYLELVSLAVGDVLYFRADDGVTGSELWRTDGTEAGTVLVKDIQGGALSSGPGSFAQVDGMLFFTAYTGTQLWRSNGTANGTQLVRNFSVATSLYGHQGSLYFAGDPDNSGQELWKSNGTFGTTERLKDLNGVFGASLPINFHSAGDLLYFDAATDTGWELWATDGTGDGTYLVKDINPGSANGTLDGYADVTMTNRGDTLYFGANDGVHGRQLWRTTGTEASTVRISNLPDGVDASCNFPVVDDHVLVNNYAVDRWWAYYPTTDTTLESGYPSASYFNFYDFSPSKYLFVDGTLLYAGKDTAYGCEIWRSDGIWGDAHRTQETNFTDNWTPLSAQPFNSILGTVNGLVLFTQARTPYDPGTVALFSHDAAEELPCRAPRTSFCVSVEDGYLTVLCDRISNYGLLTVRYRQPGSSIWEMVDTNGGYAELPVDATLPWEYNVRNECDGVLSDWSPLFTYDPATQPQPAEASILADRSTEADAVSIYWTRTAAHTNMKMRFRPYADQTAPWVEVNNATGRRRLTDLLPETLYEYQYRIRTNDVWTDWTTTSLYFTTQSLDISTAIVAQDAVQLTLSPNPATDMLHISGLAPGIAHLRVFDALGKCVLAAARADGTLDVRSLRPGHYVLEVLGNAGPVRARFVVGPAK